MVRLRRMATFFDPEFDYLFPFHNGSIETEVARSLKKISILKFPFHNGSIETVDGPGADHPSSEKVSIPQWFDDFVFIFIILNIKYFRNHFFLYFPFPSFLTFSIAIHYGAFEPGLLASGFCSLL